MSEMMKYEPQSYGELVELAKVVARSSICAVGKPEDALVILMTGAELGLTAMQSLRGIYVVKNRPVLSADTMGAVVRKSGMCEYLTLVENTDQRCTYKTKRKDDTTEEVMSWTADDAKAAGLWGGDTWKKYPRAMLRARTLATICRAVYPDVLLGMYDPEELESGVRLEDGEVVTLGNVTQIHRAPQAAHDDIEDAQLVEDSEPASNSPEDLGGYEAAPKDWSEDEEWKRAQKFYRVLISEGNILDRDELEQVHAYTRRVMGVTTSKHIDPALFKKLNAQIAAKPWEERSEWLRGKIAEMHPNPIETQLDKPVAHTAA